MSFNYSPKIPTSGLILYLDSGNTKSYPGTGITFSDIGNKKLIATMSSTVTYSGGGMLFTGGTGSYITVPASNITTSFTINSWIKPTGNSLAGTGGYLGIVNSINGNSGQRNRLLLTSTYNKLYFQASDGLATYDIFSDIFPSIQNKISMVTCTYDGTKVQFYVNGQSVLVIPYTLNISLAGGSSISTIGWGANTNDYYFNGTIYNYSLYNKGLSNSEVFRLYSALYSRYGL